RWPAVSRWQSSFLLPRRLEFACHHLFVLHAELTLEDAGDLRPHSFDGWRDEGLRVRPARAPLHHVPVVSIVSGALAMRDGDVAGDLVALGFFTLGYDGLAESPGLFLHALAHLLAHLASDGMQGVAQ